MAGRCFAGCPTSATSIRWVRFMADGRRPCMDSALGCAVHTTMEIGEAYTTAEFKVNLLRPITPGTGEVVCESRVVHRGRTLAVSEATLKDKAGKLLAFGTETCSIFPVANLHRR